MMVGCNDTQLREKLAEISAKLFEARRILTNATIEAAEVNRRQALAQQTVDRLEFSSEMFRFYLANPDPNQNPDWLQPPQTTDDDPSWLNDDDDHDVPF